MRFIWGSFRQIVSRLPTCCFDCFSGKTLKSKALIWDKTSLRYVSVWLPCHSLSRSLKSISYAKPPHSLYNRLVEASLLSTNQANSFSALEACLCWHSQAPWLLLIVPFLIWDKIKKNKTMMGSNSKWVFQWNHSTVLIGIKYFFVLFYIGFTLIYTSHLPQRDRD